MPFSRGHTSPHCSAVVYALGFYPIHSKSYCSFTSWPAEETARLHLGGDGHRDVAPRDAGPLGMPVPCPAPQGGDTRACQSESCWDTFQPCINTCNTTDLNCSFKQHFSPGPTPSTTTCSARVAAGFYRGAVHPWRDRCSSAQHEH